MGAVSKILAGLVVLAALALSAVLVVTFRYLDQPLPLTESVVVEIPAGRGLGGVAGDLADRGLLDHPVLFTLYGRWMSASGQIKAGEYRIEPGQTPAGLLEQFVDGRVMLHAVTLIEGWTFRQALEAVRGHPAVTVTTGGLSEEELARRLSLPTPSPEGWLLPDTYHFPRNTQDLAVLGMAAHAMEEALDLAWSQRAADLPLERPYQALILASIIEKETALADERSQIAGVFVRRLQKGMRLQTDPTVIYGLGTDFDGNLRKADLLRDTPYNSYTRSGLPPTPIALPGREALVAAVQPEDGEALYFVATGKGDGSHYFSATLEEHNRAVARYLARLREGKD